MGRVWTVARKNTGPGRSDTRVHRKCHLIPCKVIHPASATEHCIVCHCNLEQVIMETEPHSIPSRMHWQLCLVAVTYGAEVTASRYRTALTAALHSRQYPSKATRLPGMSSWSNSTIVEAIDILLPIRICTYMFKAIHGLGPEYINCFVERYMPVRALRSSCNGILLKVTVPRKTIGQSSFSVAGPQMWNDLPIGVRSAQSLMMFRKHLKTYLFRRHYLAWTLSPASQFYQNILKLKLL